MQTGSHFVGIMTAVAVALMVTCGPLGAAEGDKQLVVQAGGAERAMLPMSIEAPAGIESPKMVDADSGKEVPCQISGGKLWWILDKLPANQTKTYRVSAGEKAKPIVTITRQGEHTYVVKIADKELTRFQSDPTLPRPFFYPLFGPEQVRLTRGSPMENIPGEVKDHKHHRSLWVAYGEVNGVDNWSEEKNHGRQITRKVESAEGGPVFGQIDATIDWVDKEGKKNMEEQRRTVFYAIDGQGRFLDLTVTFKATEGNVEFGDTKEGGICSLRVSEELREGGKQGGLITNSLGQKTEKAAWGKKANWVDYSRTKGQAYGVAVFDTPGNLNYPAHWHVRGYGLFSVNPFATKAFNDKAPASITKLEKGKEMTFRYRLYLHEGDVEKAQVAGRYEDYVNPPKAEWK